MGIQQTVSKEGGPVSIYLTLFVEFFKIGLFAIGGGLATIPFLYDLAERYPWISPELISDMIAVSESTPGPIGINTATYVGFNAGGIPGAMIAPFAITLPSFLIILMLAKAMQRVHTNPYVITVFSGIRPVVTALIAAAALEILKTALFQPSVLAAGGEWLAAVQWKPLVLFLVLLGVSLKKQFHPIVLIAVAGAAGILFQM